MHQDRDVSDTRFNLSYLCLKEMYTRKRFIAKPGIVTMFNAKQGIMKYALQPASLNIAWNIERGSVGVVEKAVDEFIALRFSA